MWRSTIAVSNETEPELPSECRTQSLSSESPLIWADRPAPPHSPSLGNSGRMTTCIVTSYLSPSRLGQLSHQRSSPDTGWDSRPDASPICCDRLRGNWHSSTGDSGIRKKVSLSCIWEQRPRPQKPQQESPCFLSQLQLAHMSVAAGAPPPEGFQQARQVIRQRRVQTKGTCRFQERNQTEWPEDVGKLRQN